MAPATAQDYPARPIRVITVTSAGGTSDIFMRALADEMQKGLGQPIVIENRPGGAFNIGARACAEAAPDGYTICILPGEPMVFSQFLFKSLAYDPAAFEPVTQLFTIVQALVVSKALNVKTLSELVALSKAKPGTLSYSTGSVPFGVFFDRIKRETGADIVRVPFRGGGEAVNALLIGRDAGRLSRHLQRARRRWRAGLVTGLMVDSDKRSPLFPDIPTIPEATGKEFRRAVLFRHRSRRPARRSRSRRSSRPRSRASRPSRISASAISSSAGSIRWSARPRRSAASSSRIARSPRRSSRKPGSSRSSGERRLDVTIKPVSRQTQAPPGSLCGRCVAHCGAHMQSPLEGDDHDYSH